MQTKEQAVSQQTSIQLPSFNEVIEIKVEVQDIFNKLLNEFPPEYKHRELVAHAIIGSTKDGPIGFIYNALNGYSPMIDFQVGNVVICSQVSRKVRYDAIIENEKGESIPRPVEPHKPLWRTRRVEIGKCKVIGINLYSYDKLYIEFEEDSSYDNEKIIQTAWVSHKLCTKWYPAV